MARKGRMSGRGRKLPSKAGKRTGSLTRGPLTHPVGALAGSIGSPGRRSTGAHRMVRGARGQFRKRSRVVV